MCIAQSVSRTRTQTSPAKEFATAAAGPWAVTTGELDLCGGLAEPAATDA